jgi:hypothetical protein
MERFAYEGDVYVRPIGRGVMLENTNSDLMTEIERLIDAPMGPGWGWEGRLRIVVEKLAYEASQ